MYLQDVYPSPGSFVNGFGVLNVPPSFAAGNPSSIAGNLNVTDPRLSAKYGQFGSPRFTPSPSPPPAIYNQHVNGGAPSREEEWSQRWRHNNGSMENGRMDGVGGTLGKNNGGRDFQSEVRRIIGGAEGFGGMKGLQRNRRENTGGMEGPHRDIKGNTRGMEGLGRDIRDHHGGIEEGMATQFIMSQDFGGGLATHV